MRTASSDGNSSVLQLRQTEWSRASDNYTGQITIDHLAPDSVVIVHSALVHGRRQRPGGTTGPRYFTDVSYCQQSTELDGRRWPAYQVFHSKAGAGDNSSKKINALHLSRGRGGIDGRYNFLYDTDAFYTFENATPAQQDALARPWKTQRPQHVHS